MARVGTIVNGVRGISRFLFYLLFFSPSFSYRVRETTCRFTQRQLCSRDCERTRALIGSRAICRESSSQTREFPGRALATAPRLLRRCKRNVIAQANGQLWPRLQGRFDYYPAAVEDAAETHRSEAAHDASAQN